MRTIVLASVAAVGFLSVASLEAAAIPVDGAAIANIGQQVAPVINVATKKKKKAQAPAAQAACPADKVRSNKTGSCITEKSQY